MKSVQLILLKVVRRLRLNLMLLKVVELLKVHDAKKIDKENIDCAYSYLDKISKRPNTTCLCHNQIDAKYDLHIIIPAYNVGHYICECVDSVLSQKTNYSFWVTIVNDGSTDDTANLLERYQNIGNVEIINQENRGFSGARNSALSHIKGKYVMFLDSDDIMGGQAIDKLLKEAINNDLDLVEGSYAKIRDDKNTLCYKCIVPNYMGDVKHAQLSGYVWGKIYKSELFEQFCFPEHLWFEDTILQYFIYPRCKQVATVSDIVYLYRINNSGISAVSVGKRKVVDTLWMTSLVLEENQMLGIGDRNDILNSFLQQTKMDFQRIETLCDPKANKACFIVHCDLLHKYFGSLNTKSSSLAESLRNGDYLYYSLCNL